MAKAHCYPAKTGYGCPRPVAETDRCPNHPDLYLLRTPLRTGGARSPTTWLARPKLVDEIFLDVAEDEMEHYAETMRLISLIRSSRNARRRSSRRAGNETADRQAEMGYPPKKPRSGGCRGPPGKKICPPFNHHLKAIQDELHAINKYQRYMNDAEEPRVKGFLPSDE